MKTKPLTFLLSLTFLFLFNGNSFGNLKKQVAKKQVAKKIVELDKKDESVVLFCPGSEGGLERYVSVQYERENYKGKQSERQYVRYSLQNNRGK